MAATQNITPVCVNDRIEAGPQGRRARAAAASVASGSSQIAVNLFNAMGLVDVDKAGAAALPRLPRAEARRGTAHCTAKGRLAPAGDFSDAGEATVHCTLYSTSTRHEVLCCKV